MARGFLCLLITFGRKDVHKTILTKVYMQINNINWTWFSSALFRFSLGFLILNAASEFEIALQIEIEIVR